MIEKWDVLDKVDLQNLMMYEKLKEGVVLIVVLLLVASVFGAAVTSVESEEQIETEKEKSLEYSNRAELQGLADSTWPNFQHDRDNTGRSIHNMDDVEGKEKWNYETDDGIWSSPSVGEDGTIYVGSYDNHLYAIDPDGTEKWSFETDGSISYSSPAIAEDGTIYIGSTDNYLYAINPDGTEKWSFETEDGIYRSPTIGPLGMIFVGDREGYLYAINPDGSEEWRYDTNPGHSPSEDSPVIWGTTIYYGTAQRLFALDKNEGTKEWDKFLGGQVFAAPTIGSDGTIYQPTAQEELYAINPDGTEKWLLELDYGSFYSPAIGYDGTIYIPSIDLLAVNPDGTVKWSFQTGENFNSPLAVCGGDIIYGTNDDNTLYAVNPDGTLRWVFEMEEAMQGSPSAPAIDSEDTIYVGSHNSNLYAIGPRHGVTVYAPPNQTESDSGTYTYTFEVENTGNKDDTFDLSATAEEGGWSADAPSTVSVPSESSKTVNVDVTIPDDAEGGDSSEVQLEAISQTDLEESDTGSMTVSLEEIHGVSVDPPNDQTEDSHGTYYYDFEVENEGNLEDTYSLEVDAEENSWFAKVMEDEKTIPVGGLKTVEVEVEISGGVEGGESSEIYLEAVSQGDPGVSDIGSMTVTLGAGYGISVEPPSDQTEDSPGTYPYYFDIKNTGNTVDTYDLEATADEDDWSASVDSPETVSPGEIEIVEVEVEIPGDAEGGDSGEIYLEAVSQGDPGVSDTDSMTVSLEEIYGVLVNPPEDQTEDSPDTYYYDFEVENEGTLEDTFNLEATADVPDWSAYVKEEYEEITIPMGGTETVEVEVKISEDVEGGDSSDIHLEAISQGDPDLSDTDLFEVTLQPEYDISVYPPGDQTEDSPDTYIYEFDLENTGTIQDTYDLEATADAPDWYADMDEEINIPVGSTETVEVEVEIPDDVDDGDSSEITLEATSQGDPEVSSSASMQVTFSGEYGVTVESQMEDDSVDEPGVYTYEFEVENTGNVDDTYDLVGEADEPGWSAKLAENEGDSISVPAGEIAEMKVDVTVSEDAEDGETSWITLEATSQGEPAVSSSDSMLVEFDPVLERDVSVNPPSDAVENSPGTYQYEFEVENTGDTEDVYELTAEPDQTGWSAEVKDNTEMLSPAEIEVVDVKVTIPEDVEEGESSAVSLEAVSEEDLEISATESMDVIFSGEYGVAVTARVDEDVVTELGVHTYEFDVENTGKVSGNYELTAEVDQADWSVEPEQSTVSLTVDEVVVIEVNVTIPESGDDETEKSGEVTLEAQSEDVPEVSTTDSFTLIYDPDPELYEFEVQIEGEGHIERDEDELEEGTHEFEAGRTLSLRAVPVEGWLLEEWTGGIDAEEYQEEITITLEEDTSITARFVEIFILGEVSVSETEIKEGSGVEITSVLTNNLPDESYEAEVLIDDEVVHVFEVPAGTEAEEFSFEHEFEEGGEYDIYVEGEYLDTVNVEKAEDPSMLSGMWWIILPLLLLVIIIPVVLFFITRGDDERDERPVSDLPEMQVGGTAPSEMEEEVIQEYEWKAPSEEEPTIDEGIEETVSCPDCGEENPLDSTFCIACGSSIEVEEEWTRTLGEGEGIECGECGERNPTDSEHCMFCGFTLKPKIEEVECSDCGFTNTADSEHCIKCGAVVGAVDTVAKAEEDIIGCPGCGEMNTFGNSHCIHCGSTLEESEEEELAGEAECPKCGYGNTADSTHCIKCGNEL